MNTLEARYGGFGLGVIIVLVVAAIAAIAILIKIRRGPENDRKQAAALLVKFALPLGAIALISLLRECR